MKRLPGARAKRVIARDKKYLSPSYTRIYPLVVKRAMGAIVEDLDGNKFLDFTAGIAVCNTGHSHPLVVAAIKDQSEKLIHFSGTDFYYEPMADLAEVLAKITPGKGPKRVFFTNSGAEAVEAAFKLVRYQTRRPRMIAFLGAFHGRTMGALSLSASKVAQIDGFAPLVPEVTHVPYGYCYRCAYNLTYDNCKLECVSYIEDVLFKEVLPPDEVAAIITEPIQGEGGVIVPPPEFHKMLKSICRKYGIIFIADEIQTGMGRTGKMLAMEHWGTVPDIICLAKGIASGLPLGAMIARKDLMTWPKGAHASTFGGNPVSCRASLETIKLLKAGLVENAREVGDYILERLNLFKDKYDFIGDVRGMGLLIGVEIVKNRKTKLPDVKKRDSIIERCFGCRLLLLACGESVVRFTPPLVITQSDAERACDIFEEVVGGF